MAKDRKEYRHNYYMANKERLATYSHNYYLAHKEDVSKKMREWQENNREKCRENCKRWKQNNPEAYIACRIRSAISFLKRNGYDISKDGEAV